MKLLERLPGSSFGTFPPSRSKNLPRSSAATTSTSGGAAAYSREALRTFVWPTRFSAKSWVGLSGTTPSTLNLTGSSLCSRHLGMTTSRCTGPQRTSVRTSRMKSPTSSSRSCETCLQMKSRFPRSSRFCGRNSRLSVVILYQRSSGPASPSWSALSKNPTELERTSRWTS